MHFGYNTNGFAHHRLEDALRILAELGYRSVAITLDYHVLNPFGPERKQVSHVRKLLEELGLQAVVETGARFLLDPWRKHQPTLLSADRSERQRRLEFLQAAIDMAAELGSGIVSFWSGSVREPSDEATLLARLVEGCQTLCEQAVRQQVKLAFEPEPGMFIDTMPRFADLHQAVAHPSFGLTLDIGHLHCLGEIPIADHVRHWQSWLWNIHIEDMRRGVHDHRMFGEGEIDFVPVLRTLQEIGYRGGLHVELSRHSHNAVETARQALRFLQEVAEKT